MIADVAQEHADLAVIDFASVPTPLAFDPDRVRAALGETARIEGDDAIGLAQLMDYLRHQHLDQGTMIPWRGANELLDDLSLDINERGNVLGIFAGQVREQPLEIEVEVALSGLGLQRLLVEGTTNSARRSIMGLKTSGETMQSLNNASGRCAHVSAIFSPPGCALPKWGAGREAIVFTTRYVMQQGAKAGQTVGIR